MVAGMFWNVIEKAAERVKLMMMQGDGIKPVVNGPKRGGAGRAKVKRLKGPEVEVDVCSDMTVATLKKQLEVFTGIPANSQRVVFGGKELSDSITMECAGVGPDDVLHLVMRM